MGGLVLWYLGCIVGSMPFAAFMYGLVWLFGEER